MVEPIGSIASAIAANLGALSRRDVGSLWGVKHELRDLGQEVSILRAVLEDAEEQYYRRHYIRVWVDHLKEALYDAQDVLEEFNLEATWRELRGRNEMIMGVRTFFSSSNPLIFKWKMTSKVRAVTERIKVINTEREEFPFAVLAQREETFMRKRETRSFVPAENVEGRDGDKEEVIKFLLDSEVKQQVSILPIIGIGGIGKTTLAKYVYNDERVREYFHLRMWTSLTHDFDARQIMKAIVAGATMKEPTELSMALLQSELMATIDGKRYLLVLDDMWDVPREEWLLLRNLLEGGAKGSKILITTRVNLHPWIIGTTQPYNLKYLSEAASLSLFLKMACAGEEYLRDPDLLAIGSKIAQKCSGVPLVIRAVGALLYGKGKYEWSYFLNSELPEVAQREENIKSILELSYKHLPPHLKQCFAFCSLFPKDYVIKKQTLINLWVAEGFIQPSDGSQHLEDIAHEYFMDLLWSNFFQDFQKDSVTNKEICKMPALMHDLACSIARNDPNSKLETTRHLSLGLISNLMGELPTISRSKPSSLRTILSVPTYDEMEQRKITSEADLRQLIQSFKRLHVFDLHAAIVKKVPRSICKLKHLTYLNLSHNDELKRLPNSITRLYNLQTLILQGCSALQELPRDIWKLVNLRNLDIDHCYRLRYVPRGIKQLSSLHRLTRFILPKGKAFAKNYCRLGELKGLNDLSGSLSIENLGHSRDALEESREANLKDKHSLESLVLRWHYLDIYDAEITDEDLLDELRPHPNLQTLTIDGYEGESFPNWMMASLADSFRNLVEVRLLRCGKCKLLSQLGQLDNLKSLELWGLTELEDIKSDQSPTSTISFPKLLKLEIRYCKKLKAMPQTPHLEELNLREVNLEFFTRMIGLNKLKSLDISQMEFLKFLPEECLRSLTSLERLGISECPQLISLSGMRHLPNLVHLSFSNCEELDLSKGKSGLTKLRFMDIHGVPKLASFPQWLLQANNLEHLSIKKCLNLKALPEHINDLRSLQKLEIIRCPSLTSLPEGMQRLSSLTHLRIAGCPELEGRCKKDAGDDWNKIARIHNISHKLEFNERHS